MLLHVFDAIKMRRKIKNICTKILEKSILSQLGLSTFSYRNRWMERTTHDIILETNEFLYQKYLSSVYIRSITKYSFNFLFLGVIVWSSYEMFRIFPSIEKINKINKE